MTGPFVPERETESPARSLVVFYHHVGRAGEGFAVRPVARLSVADDAAKVEVTILDERHARAVRVIIDGPRASSRHDGPVTTEDGADFLDAVLRDTATSSTWGALEERPPMPPDAPAPSLG